MDYGTLTSIALSCSVILLCVGFLVFPKRPPMVVGRK